MGSDDTIRVSRAALFKVIREYTGDGSDADAEIRALIAATPQEQPRRFTDAERALGEILKFCDEAEQIYRDAGIKNIPGVPFEAALISTHGVRATIRESEAKAKHAESASSFYEHDCPPGCEGGKSDCHYVAVAESAPEFDADTEQPRGTSSRERQSNV